jgi:hypothetical protein
VKKSLYRLKQSGREWYLEAYKGPRRTRTYTLPLQTPCIFVYKDQKLIVGLYVDDIVILADDIQVVRDFKAGIAKR